MCIPLQMKSLHLLSKFHGYIGLGKKWMCKLPPELLGVDLKDIGSSRRIMCIMADFHILTAFINEKIQWI